MNSLPSKKHVTLFIPTYNEEQNIEALLKALLGQQLVAVTIDAILVIDDASTDTTVEAAEKIAALNPIIKVMKHTDRKGVAQRATELFQSCTSAYIIRIDADVSLHDNNCIENLMEHAQQNTGLICGNVQVHQPKNLVQKIGHFGKQLWNSVKDSLPDEQSIAYRCHGALYALSQSFAHSVSIPKTIGSDDDTYLFFDAKRKGYDVSYAQNAIVYQQLPKTLKDYLSQHVRYSVDTLSKHVESSLLNQYKNISFGATIGRLIPMCIRQPIVGTLYIIIRGYSVIISKFHTPTTTWLQPKSTKKHD